MWRRRCLSAAIGCLWVLAGTAPADDRDVGRLKLVESQPRDELDSVVTSVISPDGKFLYASSWKPGILAVFARDGKSGALDLRQTINDPELLMGVTGLALSGDGDLAAAASFRSRTVVLYLRDRQKGVLSRLDIARDGENGVRLGFPVFAAFSPDSRGVVVIDDSGPNQGHQGSAVSFRVVDGKLVLAGIDEGKDGCYAGARGGAFHPDGKTLFVAANRPGTLIVADRDPTTARTSVRQVIRDEEGEVTALGGAMGVAVSRDGRFVYVSSGRFAGDDAVSVFRFGTDRRLTLVQQIVNGQGELADFEGGNGIAISPDGLSVYAAATRSGRIACFRRDPTSGKLKVIEVIGDGGQGGPQGVASIGVSPDGRFVYAPTEDKSSISIFRRETGR